MVTVITSGLICIDKLLIGFDWAIQLSFKFACCSTVFGMERWSLKPTLHRWLLRQRPLYIYILYNNYTQDVMVRTMVSCEVITHDYYKMQKTHTVLTSNAVVDSNDTLT